MAESFFSSLKKERIRKRIYKTRDLARADIFNYIEVFYNRARRHSHLDGVSPSTCFRILVHQITSLPLPPLNVLINFIFG